MLNFGPMNTQIINIIPATYVDDFFVFGFLGGLVSYAWYLFTSRRDERNHLSILAGIYGVFLSGCLGGLLAIAIDRSIEISIIVGLLNQILYISIIRSVKNDGFIKALKEVLISLLTGGLTKGGR